MKKVLRFSNYSISETAWKQRSQFPAEVFHGKILLTWLKCKGMKERRRSY